MKHHSAIRMHPLTLGYVVAGALLTGMILSGAAGWPDKVARTASHDGKPHVHALVEVDPANAPSVAIRAERDALSGWNIHLDVRNFTFAPELVNRAHVANTGHAHLYLNGKKIARLYGKAFHLAHLPVGENTLTVSLNANDHSDLALGGARIDASVVIGASDTETTAETGLNSERAAVWNHTKG